MRRVSLQTLNFDIRQDATRHTCTYELRNEVRLQFVRGPCACSFTVPGRPIAVPFCIQFLKLAR